MCRQQRTVFAFPIAIALAIVPGLTQADWNDWYEGGWGSSFGEYEYGTGLDGRYDNENADDDWYYDSYDYDSDGYEVGGDITDDDYADGEYLNRDGGDITDDDYAGDEFTEAEGYLDGDFAGDEDLKVPSEGEEGYGFDEGSEY